MQSKAGAPEIVLASGSTARARMLRDAGVSFTVRPASVDEGMVKAAMRADGADVETVAEALAATKAQQVSRSDRQSLVIGADQMLTCGDDWFDKPTDAEGAKDQILSLRGRTHRLISAVCVVQAGDVLWHHVDSATLTMRPFSDDFLAGYVKNMGEKITATVGGYELEGIGIQLFSRIDGDCFTILGMPLLPILDFLRGHGAIAE